jgi:hypothetical protein
MDFGEGLKKNDSYWDFDRGELAQAVKAMRNLKVGWKQRSQSSSSAVDPKAIFYGGLSRNE